MKRQWTCAAATVVLLACALVVASHFRLKPEPVSPRKRKQLLEELTAADTVTVIASLTPDHEGRTLACINLTDDGRQVVLLNPATKEQHPVPTASEVERIYGWSPDDRYLAFGQTPSTHGNPFTRMRIYDRQTDSIRWLTGDPQAKEVAFLWLPSGAFVVASRWPTNDHAAFYLGRQGDSLRERIADYPGDFTILTESLGVFQKNDLFTLELKPLRKNGADWDETSKVIHKITDFHTNDFNGLPWVNYSPATSNFLFCSRPTFLDWRFLYRWDAVQGRLTQLTHEDTYNGQFLLDGAGFACIINTNNSFQLAIRPGAGAAGTNLFTAGNVVVYKATPKGDKVYAAASLGCEPHGIWEYTVTNQALRKVADGSPRPLQATKIVEPGQFTVKSFDGTQIPCFLFPPAALADRPGREDQPLLGRLLPRVKYPAVIHIPATTWQFQRRFEHQSQLFANLGFYYAAVNYRGCDGYGTAYSNLANTRDAARDVLAVYEKLVSNPDIDARNIFITTTSAGTAVLHELLTTHPRLWAGVAIDKAGRVAINPALKPAAIPPMIMTIGADDPHLDLPDFNALVTWAKTNHLEFRAVMQTNTGHSTYRLGARRAALQEFAEFFTTHLR